MEPILWDMERKSFGHGTNGAFVPCPRGFIPTFFLKGLMGYLVGIIGKKEVTSLHSPYLLLASLIGTLEGIIGYTLVGAIIYHSLPTGLMQAPGLIVEGIVNMVAFYMIYGALNAGKVKQLFKR